MKTHPGYEIKRGEDSLEADTPERIEKLNEKISSPVIKGLEMEQSQLGDTLEAKGTVLQNTCRILSRPYRLGEKS